MKAISKTHMKTDTHDNQLPPTMTHEPISNDCVEPSLGVMLRRGAILEVLRAKVIPTGLRNFCANKQRFFSKRAISKRNMKTDSHDNQLPPIMTHEPITNDCVEPSSGVMLRRGAVSEGLPSRYTFKNKNTC